MHHRRATRNSSNPVSSYSSVSFKPISWIPEGTLIAISDSIRHVRWYRMRSQIARWKITKLRTMIKRLHSGLMTWSTDPLAQLSRHKWRSSSCGSTQEEIIVIPWREITGGEGARAVENLQEVPGTFRHRALFCIKLPKSRIGRENRHRAQLQRSARIIQFSSMNNTRRKYLAQTSPVSRRPVRRRKRIINELIKVQPRLRRSPCTPKEKTHRKRHRDSGDPRERGFHPADYSGESRLSRRTERASDRRSSEPRSQSGRLRFNAKSTWFRLVSRTLTHL